MESNGIEWVPGLEVERTWMQKRKKERIGPWEWSDYVFADSADMEVMNGLQDKTIYLSFRLPGM
jgi:hypothetical protein